MDACERVCHPKKIDVERLKADLPQIYAECVERLRQGERYWPSDEIQADYFAAEQEERRSKMNWEGMFENLMKQPIAGFALKGEETSYLDRAGVGISREDLATFFETYELFNKRGVPSSQWLEVLRRRGWESKPHRFTPRGTQKRFWAKKGSPDVLDAVLKWHVKGGLDDRGYWMLDHDGETVDAALADAGSDLGRDD